MMDKTNLYNKTGVYVTNITAPVPTAPIIKQYTFIAPGMQDPSSAARADKYPIPSFFEYRMLSGEYDY